MGQFETVRNAIDQLDGGTFQQLVSRYASLKYKCPAMFNLGISAGTLKPAKGTPDSFYLRADGTCVFLESGAYSKHAQAIKKLDEDARKCLGEEEASLENGVNLHLCKIVLAFTYGHFTPDELAHIRAIDSRIDLIGPDELAQACTSTYAFLSREYFGIDVYSPFIMDAVQYMQRCDCDAFCPSIRGEVLGRMNDLANVKQDVERYQAVLLRGRAGCGKTRLALEVLNTASEKDGIDCYVIVPGQKSLGDSLPAYAGGGRKTLLLVDDANDVAPFMEIVEFALLHAEVHLLVTVRDYASAAVERALSRLKSFHSVDIRPLSSDCIREVLKSRADLDYAVRDRICHVAKGNLRVALLAIEAADEDKFEGSTIKTIFAAAYGQRLDCLGPYEKTSIAVASLLGAHRINENQNLSALETRLGLAHSDYVLSCRELCNKELMDATSTFDAVCFEEQNLRDYFRYQILIEEERLTLTDIWQLQFGPMKCKEIMGSLLSVFGDERVYEVLRLQLRELLDSQDDISERLTVVEYSGSLLGRTGIAVIRAALEGLSDSGPECSGHAFDFNKNQSVATYGSEILRALEGFMEDEKYRGEAVHLALELIRRTELSDTDLSTLLFRHFAPRFYRNPTDCRAESYVLDRLGDKEYLPSKLREDCIILFCGSLFSCMDQIYHLTGDAYKALERHLPALRRRSLEMTLRIDLDVSQIRFLENHLLALQSGPLRIRSFLLAALSDIDELYVPSMNNIGLRRYGLVSKFATRCHKAGVRCVNADGIMQASKAAVFVDAVLKLSLLSDKEDYEDCARLIAQFDGCEWDAIALILDNSKGEDDRYAWAFGRVFGALFSDEEIGVAVKKNAFDAVATRCPALVLAYEDCLEWAYEAVGVDAIRKMLSRDGLLDRARLLQTLDTYLIERKHRVPEVSVLLEAAERYGEILSFATVCEAEASSKGFFHTYLSGLLKAVPDYSLFDERFFPMVSGEFAEHLAAIDLNDANAEVLVQAVCQAMERRHGYDDDWTEARLSVLEGCVALLPAYFDSLLISALQIRCFDSSFLKPFARSLAERSDWLETLRFVVSDLMANSSSEWILPGSLVHLSIYLLKELIAKYKIAEVVAVICEAADAVDCELKDAFIGAVTELPYEIRVSFVATLAKAGLSGDDFSRAALDYPYTGYGWSGSGLPYLNNRLGYLNELENSLADSMLFAQSAVVEDVSERLNREIEELETKEFCEPWFGRG